MENTLDHLLKVEAQAANLINDAKTEAARRIRENEEKNLKAYNERIKAEVEIQEASLKKENDRIKNEYKEKLENYRNEISNIVVDIEKFSSLLDSYLENKA